MHANVANGQIHNMLLTSDSINFTFHSSSIHSLSLLRACAAAALKDVTIYFTKEQGQVAVSKRTSENVPLNYLTF